MAARIDLSTLTETQKTITAENPEVTIVDAKGSGARVRLLTVPAENNKNTVVGVELISSGSNYTQVTDWSLGGTIVDDYIKLVYFPPNFYSDPTVLTPVKRYRLKFQVTSDELQDNVSTKNFTKFAILSNPKLYGTDAVAKYPSGDGAFRPLVTNLFAITGPYSVGG